jgi:hypothetical protein
MNEPLCAELLQMAQEDQSVREKLRLARTLFAGYHPEMEAVHQKNSARLQEMLALYGWPGRRLVGREGANAAWLILQHSISSPPLMRRALPLVQAAAAAGDSDSAQAALLYDRICILEARPQRYGTQYDWDQEGQMSSYPIADAAAVDNLRHSVGLDSLEENTKRIRASLAHEQPPADLAARRAEAKQWARKVGWR